ncbi:hypothetical protein BJV78DRAFT_1223172 [Lactifluus subvellereus]|nr:hypothetical protein BJV78DRAFT_1223172 [Lactifluus subvellereus]
MDKALFVFLHHTLSSNLGQDPKQRRIDICRNAMDAASLYITWPSCRRVFYEDWTGLLNCVEFGLFLKAAKHGNSLAEYYSDHVIAAIIATLQLSRAVLEGYSTNSVLLANCIDNCHRTRESYLKNDLVIPWRSRSLGITSDFAARDTCVELQHEFCRLWNGLIRMIGASANRRKQELATCILRHTRKVYIVLHEGTNSVQTAFSASTDNYAKVLFDPSSYRPCNVTEHDSRIDEATTGPTEDAPSPSRSHFPHFHSSWRGHRCIPRCCTLPVSFQCLLS